MITTIAFHDAVTAIYNAATTPDLWPRALDLIARCTGDVGTVLMWKRDDGGFGTIVSPALEAAQADYVAHWWQSDIRAFRGVERGYLSLIDGSTDADIVSEEEARTHPIYTDFLIPHGLGWFAAAGVSPDPSIYVVVSVQRRHDRPRFSADEVRLVSMLGRHVEQSLRLSMRLIDAEVTRTGLSDALSRLSIAVFGLDSIGRVTLVNEAGNALLGHGLAIDDGHLRPENPGDRASFDGAVRDVVDEIAEATPKPIVLRPDGGDQPFVLYFLPVADRDAAARITLGKTELLVLALPIGRKEAVDPTLLRDLMGLTLNEARVAALIGSGMAPRAVAGHLGIAEETARTVLKRVFAKTGVSRQSELVALLVGLALR